MSAEYLGAMYRELIDADADETNPSRSSNPTSRASSLGVPTSTVGGQRRNPFSVSPSGSPLYSARTNSPMMGMSPTRGSKIPRKVPATTAPGLPLQTGTAVASQRSTRSRLRRGNKSHAGPSVVPKRKPSLRASRDKPLPGAPIAQVVNASSPPKAQRTLVDADVVGAPSFEEWPILSPEIVLPKDKAASVIQTSVESISNNISRPGLPWELHPHIDTKDCPASVPLITHNEYKSTALPAPASYDNSNAAIAFSSPLIDVGTSVSSDPTVHALTTVDNEAWDSPLAGKMAVPHVSSKQDSSPLPVRLQDSQIATARLSAAWPPLDLDADSGNKKRPLIDTKEYEGPGTTALQSERLGASGFSLSDENTARTPTPLTAHASRPAIPQHASFDSTSSTWSRAAGSSLDEEPQLDGFPCSRVKHLSSHSLRPGFGATLRIAYDADSIIYGNEVPPIPDIVTGRKSSQERTISALTGRMSLQTRSNFSAVSRSVTSLSLGTNKKISSAVKDGSVRSRHISKSSVTLQSKTSPSPIVPSSHESRRTSKLPMRSFNGARHVSEPSQRPPPQETTVSQPKDSSRATPTPIRRAAKTVESKKISPPNSLLAKANSTVASRSSPSASDAANVSATSKGSREDGLLPTKISTTDRSKTSPLLVQTNPRISRTSGNRLSSPIAASRSAQSPRDKSLGPTRSRLAGGAMSAGNSTRLDDQRASRKAVSKPRSERPDNSVGKDTNGYRKDENKSSVGAAGQIKAKRSLRNLFHFRDIKEKVPPLPVEPKRPSLTKSTLAKRFVTSTKFSKANPHKTAEAETERGPASKAGRIPSKTQSKDIKIEKSSSRAVDGPSAISSDTTAILSKIVGLVAQLPDKVPDRLRGLEAAEVVLNCVDACRLAKIAAEEAKKHAREAELQLDMGAMALGRLQQLFRHDLNNETLHEIDSMARRLRSTGSQQSPSPAQ